MTSTDSAISFQVRVEKRADGARAEYFILCCFKAEARLFRDLNEFTAQCVALSPSLCWWESMELTMHSWSLAFCQVTVAIQIYLYIIYIALSFWLDYAKGLSPGHVTWVSRSTLRKLDAAGLLPFMVFTLKENKLRSRGDKRSADRDHCSSLKRSAHLQRCVRLIVWRQVREMCYHKHSHVFFILFKDLDA